MTKRLLQFAALIFCLASAPHVSAQVATSAPVPSQLKTATTVFLVNAGGPVNHINQEAYISFYQALLASKRFALASKPADAELAFELSVTSHTYLVFSGNSVDLNYLKLDIRDIKSQILLWSITEPISSSNNSFIAITAKNMSAATSGLVTDLNALAAGTINTQAEPAKKGRLAQENK